MTYQRSVVFQAQARDLVEWNKFLPYRIEYGFSAVSGGHLAHDVRNVSSNCVVTNSKFARHLLIAVSGRD